MKCNHCNSEVADGTKFCPYCGSPIAVPQQPLQCQYQQPYRQRPRLNIFEAIKLASQRLTEIGGRSRRSEFWWWALYISLLDTFSIIPILYVDNFIILAQTFLLYAVFSRRLHDCSAPNWLYKTVLSSFLIWSLCVFIYGFAEDGIDLAKDAVNLLGENIFFAIIIVSNCWILVGLVYAIKDSKPETDPKYGPSPKYY
jgi:uncharacterized membrane protein YhaH (DUF805 family)